MNALLRVQQRVQTVWLLLLAPFVTLQLVRAPSAVSAMWAVACAVLLMATGLLWRRSPMGRLLSLVFSAVVVGSILPWAFFNGWAFAMDDPLYVDSPATILVVVTVSCVTAVPALVVLLLSAANRRSFDESSQRT
jgi:hypothetical protein